MTAQKDLELGGTLSLNPFAELVIEIQQAGLDGSLRLNSGNQKAMVYFRDGRIVYAVSNSKSLRLFNFLLRANRIDAKTIGKHPNFANDVEFASALIAAGTLSKEVIDEAFTSQMNDILVEVLTWPDGEWRFDPLIRARDELQYPIDCQGILIDYARCASAERIYTRFKSVSESFEAVPDASSTLGLQAHEAFVLGHFNGEPSSIDEIRQKCDLPEGGILQALYVLWLGGLLIRRDWNAAFTPAKVQAIRSARLAKVKHAADLASQASPATEAAETETQTAEAVKLPTVTLTLDEYLKQVESAETHYDALGVATDAETAVIKNAYFSLAKQFHPDRYHRESDEMLKRIQSAFTVLAHAHETLKTPESRNAYNSKMYKEIEAREKRKAAGQPEVTDAAARKSEHGLESFEEGLNMINEEEYEAAAAYLARAVHYSPQNALYHAYFGHALYKADEKHRHKAEGEFQQAVKLDPKNAKVRLMLVDFLIDMKMQKRAEGELKRFLELVPNNKEALAALAKLK